MYEIKPLFMMEPCGLRLFIKLSSHIQLFVRTQITFSL